MEQMTASILPSCSRRTSGSCGRISRVQCLISDDRLFARCSYEEMLKNLNRRAQACDFNLKARELIPLDPSETIAAGCLSTPVLPTALPDPDFCFIFAPGGNKEAEILPS